MAGAAAVFWNRPVPDDHTSMTFLALDSFFNYGFVVIKDIGTGISPRHRRLMALGALMDGIIRIRAFKMTEKAGALSDSDMAPLHNLGMAARTSQLFVAAQSLEMRVMIENDIFFKGNLPRKGPTVMATTPHTALIRNFRPGFALFVNPCKVIHQH